MRFFRRQTVEEAIISRLNIPNLLATNPLVVDLAQKYRGLIDTANNASSKFYNLDKNTVYGKLLNDFLQINKDFIQTETKKILVNATTNLTPSK